MFKRLAMTAGMLMLVSTTSAIANEFYVEGFVGGPIPRDQRTFIQGVGGATFEPGDGFALGGGVGIYITPSIRADLTVLHGWNKGGTIDPDAIPGPPIPYAGRVTATVVMGNAYYEFQNDSRWTPWLGAGVGATLYNYKNAGAVGAPFSYSGSATAFTAAAHAGIDFALTDRIDITGKYSLSFTGKHTIQSTPPGFAQTPRGGIDNSFMIGVRVKFGG